ncbi:hypothetical protein HDV06_005935 [Boothiomyces sp. JEL0866]|nr:hypothetical protein HDV06_005935 [Boothiomyces sp. JEL0866]
MEKILLVTKKYYNQLLLKVHPDYFTSKPIIKRMNEKSIKELNLIMSNLSSLNMDKMSPTDIRLATSSVQKDVKLDPYRKFTPLSLCNNSRKNEILLKSWTGEIINLCRELGIEVAENDLELWKHTQKPAKVEKENFEDEIKAIILDHENNAFRLPMVIYDKGLTLHQKAVAANNLAKYLNGLPWMVGFSFQKAVGIFVIPWDFDNTLLQQYVQSNVGRVKKEFEEKLKNQSSSS